MLVVNDDMTCPIIMYFLRGISQYLTRIWPRWARIFLWARICNKLTFFFFSLRRLPCTLSSPSLVAIMSSDSPNHENGHYPQHYPLFCLFFSDSDTGTAAQSRSPSPPPQDTLTLRALVSTKDAGVIIGKAGKNVADLREQTGVKAGVSKVIPGVHERVLTVTGSVEAVSKVSRVSSHSQSPINLFLPGLHPYHCSACCRGTVFPHHAFLPLHTYLNSPSHLTQPYGHHHW